MDAKVCRESVARLLVEEIQALAQKLRVNSTPVLYTGAGKRFGGSLPAAQLEKLLSNTRTANVEKQ